MSIIVAIGKVLYLLGIPAVAGYAVYLWDRRKTPTKSTYPNEWRSHYGVARGLLPAGRNARASFQCGREKALKGM